MLKILQLIPIICLIVLTMIVLWFTIIYGCPRIFFCYLGNVVQCSNDQDKVLYITYVNADIDHCNNLR